MTFRILIPLVGLVVLISNPVAVFADADCGGCHDSAPVSADHVPVDEVNVETCTMCHVAEGDDPFFRTVHEKHGEALGCDSCHSDDSDARKAELKKLLGG